MTAIELPGSGFELVAELRPDQTVLELRRRPKLARRAADFYIMGDEAISLRSQRSDFWGLLNRKYTAHDADVCELLHLGSKNGERRSVSAGALNAVFKNAEDLSTWLDLSGEFGSFWTPTFELIRKLVARQLYLHDVLLTLIQGHSEVTPRDFKGSELEQWIKERSNLPKKPQTRFTVVGSIQAPRSFTASPAVSFFGWQEWIASMKADNSRKSKDVTVHIARPVALQNMKCTLVDERLCRLVKLKDAFAIRFDCSAFSTERAPIAQLSGLENHTPTFEITEDRINLIPTLKP